jgi:hypothetical protein
MYTLQALGVNKLVEAAWDLVPFSFVVDWMVNWRSFSRDPRSYFASHATKLLGHSIRQEWVLKPSCTVQAPPFHDGTDGPTATWQGQDHPCLSKYDRLPGFPSGTSEAGVFKSLSKTNLIDGAALILQRI